MWRYTLSEEKDDTRLVDYNYKSCANNQTSMCLRWGVIFMKPADPHSVFWNDMGFFKAVT